MLVRAIFKNIFSFNDFTEFNMLPGRFNRMPRHIYNAGELDLLKLNVMYGANGAGKSNVIKAVGLLRDFVTTGVMPIEFITQTFKFNENGQYEDIYLGIEFIKDDVPYYYDLTINQGIVVGEELQISGLDKKEDVVLFSRTDSVEKKALDIKISKEMESDSNINGFFSFMKSEFLERNKPILYYMEKRQSNAFSAFKDVLSWFRDLMVILPFYKPSGLASRLDNDSGFHAFASDIMRSFNTGIKAIEIDTVPIEDFFGEDDKHTSERITAELKANPGVFKQYLTDEEEIIFVLIDNKAFAKRLYFRHIEDDGRARFNSSEESEGTRRLLDYLLPLYILIHRQKVCLVDEIETSIHPLLIKELIRKFSHNTATRGQLIFSTHESNLLDQEIFRPDEIWFAEKNKEGATELYPLSDFKEHHTIDIRKGYLNGRYGGIPFLGNLKDLNWEVYA